jgi:hypothetical protein
VPQPLLEARLPTPVVDELRDREADDLDDGNLELAMISWPPARDSIGPE